jgi:hypothetical protein
MANRRTALARYFHRRFDEGQLLPAQNPYTKKANERIAIAHEPELCTAGFATHPMSRQQPDGRLGPGGRRFAGA